MRETMYEKANYIINIHVKHTYDGFLILKKVYDFSRNCVDFQQFQSNVMKRTIEWMNDNFVYTQLKTSV